MKVRMALAVVVVTTLMVALSVGTAVGQDPAVEKVSDFGTIDWVGEKLTAVGVGAPVSRQVGAAQKRILAKRAAVVVARRNLLEVVKGVHIDSTTRLENFLLTNDVVTSRVEGVLRNSAVDRVDYLPDGSAEAQVSIPMTGELREMLLRAAAQPPAAGQTAADARIEDRLTQLERRIQALEQQVGGLQRSSAAYRDMVHTLQDVLYAWMAYTQSRPLYTTAAMGTDAAAVNERLARQEQQLNALTARLDDMNRRLSAMETDDAKAAAPAKTQAQVKYTGLVIDARGVGFRPCLKPEIFGSNDMVYPGSYLDMEKAVTTGYVRYYRDLSKAQKNNRVGELPLTIKAIGTQSGNRSITVSAPDAELLQEIAQVQGSFLGQCRVIIVF